MGGKHKPSAFNIAVSKKIKELKKSNPSMSPQNRMAIAAKSVSGRGLYLRQANK